MKTLDCGLISSSLLVVRVIVYSERSPEIKGQGHLENPQSPWEMLEGIETKVLQRDGPLQR
jgi:hypothetical protein